MKYLNIAEGIKRRINDILGKYSFNSTTGQVTTEVTDSIPSLQDVIIANIQRAIAAVTGACLQPGGNVCFGNQYTMSSPSPGISMPIGFITSRVTVGSGNVVIQNFSGVSQSGKIVFLGSGPITIPISATGTPVLGTVPTVESVVHFWVTPKQKPSTAVPLTQFLDGSTQQIFIDDAIPEMSDFTFSQYAFGYSAGTVDDVYLGYLYADDLTPTWNHYIPQANSGSPIQV